MFVLNESSKLIYSHLEYEKHALQKMVHAKCENLQNVLIILKNAEKEFNYTRSEWCDLLVSAFSHYFSLIQIRLLAYFRSMNNCKAIVEGKCYKLHTVRGIKCMEDL